MLIKILLVGAGGFAGAISRYLVSLLTNRFLPNTSWPTATIIVNILGSFLLVFLSFSLFHKYNLRTGLLIGTGFLGAFTTFSTFSLESIKLFQKSVWQGFLYVLIMLLSSFFAAYLAYFISIKK